MQFVYLTCFSVKQNPNISGEDNANNKHNHISFVYEIQF